MTGIVQAKQWLEDVFKDGFARRSAAVYEIAKADGITVDCLKKARRALGMDTKKINDRWLMRRHQGDVPWVVSTDIQQQLDAMETSARTEESSMVEVAVEPGNSAKGLF